MAEDHTKKDKEITREEAKEMEKRLNQHTMAWSLIWNSGVDHNHQGRIITSKTSHSENKAVLTLLYKDHKEIPGKTRHVATGNESNTLGLSNCVSEGLRRILILLLALKTCWQKLESLMIK